MSEFTSFFRHCPSCGRRFEIRLVGKKLVDEKHVTEEAPLSVPPLPSYPSLSQYSPAYNELVESVPLTVDIKEFQYAYKCRHCGHQWSEIR
ncbi:MAG TPA: hypothetical protein VEJ19_09160 [Nitrososphaerales archaeon]|nr:hypothetical protein [Nitrososphaerales archaeon]